MDVSIASFYNRNQREINKIIDQTFFRLLEPITPLDRFMPVRNYLSRKLLLLKFKGHRPTVASVVAEEQEIPASRPRATLDEQVLSNLKLGKKLVFKARDFEMMQELNRYASEAGPQSAQMVNEIKHYFFGMAADLVPTLIEKHTVLTMQVATTGGCDFTDPLTGAIVNFTYPDLEATLLPAALVGPALWSAAGTSTPLTNLETHARAYYDRLGYWPPAVIMHFEQLRQIADSTEAKIAHLRTIGADSAAPDTTGVYLSDEQVMDMIKARTRSRDVVIFDAQYSEELENGSVVDKYFLPEGWYLFAKDEYMERAIVPTVEKNFEAGVFFHSKVVEESPRIERSVAAANGIPFIGDQRCIAARKVA